MKMRFLLLLTAMLLAGCSINPYSGTRPPVVQPEPPVPEQSKPVVQPKQPAPEQSQPVVSKPVKKPKALLGLAKAMANAFVQSSPVQALAQRSPILLLTPPQNSAAEDLDTQAIAVAMQKQIQAHSVFRFVDGNQVKAITRQLEYQQAGVNPASLVRLGRQTGANYMLYGEVSGSASQYRLAMSLMELRSGELLWQESREGAQ